MTSPPPPKRHDLLLVDLGPPAGFDHVQMMRIELGPGQPAGRHRHPCPVIGCVLAGAIRLQIAGRPEQILEPGEAFHEPANTEILHFDNASHDQPAVFLACYLLAPGENDLIEMLEPSRP